MLIYLNRLRIKITKAGGRAQLAALYLLILLPVSAFSQDNPYDIEKLPFIDYSQNRIVVYDTLPYTLLFNKLTKVGFKGKGKVRIVHIGDSHLQADFLSGQFRRKLQTFFLGAMGGRGFVFPYKVAKTNNPLNYRISSTGTWTGCRNVETLRSCKLGLSGISVTTDDEKASINITIDDPRLAGYDFDKLMVFHEFGNGFFSPLIDDAIIKNIAPYPDKGYTLFEFSKNINSTTLKLHKSDSSQNRFTLYGFNFDSSDAGIIYHTIGVNGAQYESYLRCELFAEHLGALQPDWVIVSLGTNDVYTNVFDTIVFKSNVDSLIGLIKQAAPGTAILLTTPGDHRIRKTKINPNTYEAANILKERAKMHHLSFWDFYSVMGGSGAINHWFYNGMAHTDYLHFTQKGYEYQSQLLFNAFLRSYDDYLEKKILMEK